MIKCILINDNDASEINIKKNNIAEDNLYKKCYLKNNNNFIKINNWNYKNSTIELWGKNKGLNKFKSKYELFNKLNYDIYGKSIFVMKSNENDYISLNIDIFNELENDIIKNIEFEKDKDIEVKNICKLKKKLDDLTNDNEAINNDNDNDNDNDSISSFNSELTYEAYNYSSDNSENNE